MRAALIGLILLLTPALAGCLAIPTPYHPTDDPNTPGKTPNLAKLVGGPGSSRPLKIDSSTRADVIRVMGKPTAASNDQRIWVYAQAMSAGWGFNLIGFPGMGSLRQHTQYVRLRFDRLDVLREQRVSHGDSRSASLGYAEYSQPDKVPQKLLEGG